MVLVGAIVSQSSAAQMVHPEQQLTVATAAAAPTNNQIRTHNPPTITVIVCVAQTGSDKLLLLAAVYTIWLLIIGVVPFVRSRLGIPGCW